MKQGCQVIHDTAVKLRWQHHAGKGPIIVKHDVIHKTEVRNILQCHRWMTEQQPKAT